MTKIGRGIFQWDAFERRSDRYGFFALVAHDEDANTTESGEKMVYSDWTADDPKAGIDSAALFESEGKPVRIVAKVIEARQSRHLGDNSRGIKPTTPEAGEVIDLGVGTLRLDPSTWESGACCGDVFIGLEPNDGRVQNWFDPTKLYRLHTQTVEIEIEEVDALPKAEPAPEAGEVDGVIMSVAEATPDDRVTYQLKQTRSG